jgi:predicted GIY-YIG superfamily endonuclease
MSAQAAETRNAVHRRHQCHADKARAASQRSRLGICQEIWRALPGHVETFASPQEAIAREKQLKNWHRDWKIQLIEKDNPGWSDLSHLL